jgi:hypothetical protein
LGTTCDHSLGGSQVFTRFPDEFIEEGVLLGVPDAPNLQKIGQSFSLSVRKPAQNSKLVGAKDAQKAVGRPCKKDVS